jgi:hypothetical protein
VIGGGWVPERAEEMQCGRRRMNRWERGEKEAGVESGVVKRGAQQAGTACGHTRRETHRYLVVHGVGVKGRQGRRN